MDSNMDLINDLFGNEISYDVNIENNKDKNYYIGQGEHIIKNIENKDNYFFFLKVYLAFIPFSPKLTKGTLRTTSHLSVNF